jgi:uncharacterized protein with FMN-binding domain
MKKYLALIVVIVLIGAAIIFYRMSSATSPTAATTPNAAAATGNTTSTSGSGTPPPTSTTYTDGTYTGSVADAFYGQVQVQATIQNGAITSVKFLTYPTGGNSSVVSARAVPLLMQEAITVQSANVDIVSGATQTSQAFQQSLGAALAEAKA